MIIYSSILEKRLRSEFPQIYRRFASFVDSTESPDLWAGIVKTMNDPVLLNQIIFCNDVMKIPPVKTHLLANGVNRDLKGAENQAIGSVFGYLFKVVFGYTEQKSVSCKINTISTATRFSGAPTKIEIVR